MYYIILVTLWVYCGFMLIKNNRTYKNRRIIAEAIFLYNLNQFSQKDQLNTSVDFIDTASVVESYEKTLFRLYDWGYKNIVPADVLEKISPFIERGADNAE